VNNCGHKLVGLKQNGSPLLADTS